MQNFGIEVAQGSEITNLTIPTGTSFPANDNVGEMFYRTDEDKLYVRDNVGWAVSGGSAKVGSVITMTTSGIPDGYLKCNGATVSRTTYADLFAIVSTLYGAGDGSTTFTLPDYRGEFLRGWADDRGVDTGRGIGTYQSDDFKSHRHTKDSYASQVAGAFSGVYSVNANSFGTWGGYTGGTETRPRNRAVMYVIKY